MKLPTIDLTRFRIESMEQRLEEPSWSFGHFYSVITVHVLMVDTGKVDSLYSRKSISLMGHERASEEERSAFIKRECKAHIMWFLNHEVQECLFFDGERYEDPHPEQAWYKRALEVEEKRERERLKALEQHERLVAEEITAKYMDMRYESRDYAYSGVVFDLDLEGKPQGKTESLLEAWKKWDPETQQTQDTNALKYLRLNEQQTQTLDMLVAMKVPNPPLTQTMVAASGQAMIEAQREKDKRSRQSQNFKSKAR